MSIVPPTLRYTGHFMLCYLGESHFFWCDIYKDFVLWKVNGRNSRKWVLFMCGNPERAQTKSGEGQELKKMGPFHMWKPWKGPKASKWMAGTQENGSLSCVETLKGPKPNQVKASDVKAEPTTELEHILVFYRKKWLTRDSTYVTSKEWSLDSKVVIKFTFERNPYEL